jgi:FtsP/CotA-like multicopper oxidase with cupredoxin domain
VGPGERYTVLIHADTAGVGAWHCHILPHGESDQGMFGMGDRHDREVRNGPVA